MIDILRTVEESFIDSDGYQLWTAVQGSDVPVVLCSGGPGCCDYLTPIAEMLEGKARVVRFEPRGCGRSEHASTYSVATELADLEAVRRYYGIDKWIVVGHSWGADLALAYALERPEVVLGFACLAGGRIHNDREWHRVYREKRDAGLEPLPDFDCPPNTEVNKQVNASWKTYIQRPHLLEDIAKLTRPALFVYGSEDIRPGWATQQVANLLPRAEFRLIEGAGHSLWLSHPEQLGSFLRAFVGSFDGSQ